MLVRHLAALSVSSLLIACSGGGGSQVAQVPPGPTLPPPQASPAPPSTSPPSDSREPSPVLSPGLRPTPGCTNCGIFTAEYNAQYGLATIGAGQANDAGLTGWGVRVGMVDTGIDVNHPEFASRQISGRDFGGNGPQGHLVDEAGHGTHVSSILGASRDAQGMRGVAYDSLLYSYRVDAFAGRFLPGVATDAAWAQVLEQHITDGIQVSNNSWGSTLAITQVSEGRLRSTYRQVIPTLVRAQQQGTIFVFAAGNDGGTQPSVIGAMPVRIGELQDQWLVVVAVDEQLRETAFTNRCGLAAEFCVAAPGQDINAARANEDGYRTLSGTSMAAPHVAGVVALVYQRFPELDPAEITNRVKATASLDGLTGFGPQGCTIDTCSEAQMRAIFGHGLVNAQAATSPIGTLVYATDGNAKTSAGHELGSTSFSVPAGLGPAIADQLSQTKVAVFDSFDGATFHVPAHHLFDTGKRQNLAAIGYAAHPNALQASQGIGAHASSFALNQSTVPMFVSFSNHALTAMSATSWGAKAGFMAQPALLTNQATQQFEWGLVHNDRFSVRPFAQFAQDSDGQLLGGGLNLSFRPTLASRAHIGLAQTQSPMANSLLGNQNTNPIAMNTAEIGFEHDLNPKLSVFARSRITSLGRASASTEQWGVRGGQILQHHIGMELKLDQARVAFGAYDPGTLNNGTLTLLMPDGRTAQGQVTYREQGFSVNQQRRFGGFLATMIPIRMGSTDLGTVTFSIQQSTDNPSRVGRASLTYSHQF